MSRVCARKRALPMGTMRGKGDRVPLAAIHPTSGLLDATREGLGVELPWSAIHRTCPATPLICPGCGGVLFAKVSPEPYRMHYFAHQKKSSSCPLAGESIAHRLLKVMLANAARDAGWTANLEVAGDGWRADVLATSPDGRRRLAWEAQLAGIVDSDIQARTERMKAEGVDVCWVTDKDTAWLGHAPSIRVDAAEDEWPVIWGCERFLDEAPVVDCHHHSPQECTGHGTWEPPVGPFALGRFVKAVCQGRLIPHKRRVPRQEPWTRNAAAHGDVIWTHGGYVEVEALQYQRQERVRVAKESHQRNLEALLRRQEAVASLLARRLYAETGATPWIDQPSVDFAAGVPVYLRGNFHGVICPVISRVPRTPLVRDSGVFVFVATEHERSQMVNAGIPRGLVILVAEGTS